MEQLCGGLVGVEEVHVGASVDPESAPLRRGAAAVCCRWTTVGFRCGGKEAQKRAHGSMMRGSRSPHVWSSGNQLRPVLGLNGGILELGSSSDWVAWATRDGGWTERSSVEVHRGGAWG